MRSRSGLWIVSLQEDSSDRFSLRFSSRRGFANVLWGLGGRAIGCCQMLRLSNLAGVHGFRSQIKEHGIDILFSIAFYEFF